MFDRASDFIMKHSKAIIVVWLVVLLCSIPIGIHAGDKMVYDLTSMPGVESEAIEGQELIDEYFTNTVDLADIAVIEYDSPEELTKAIEVFEKFSESLETNYKDSDGKPFITATPLGMYSSGDVETSGVMLYAISCSDKDFDVVHETDEFRGYMSDAVNGYSLKTYITGSYAITYDTEYSSVEDVKKVDPLSVALIFILLGLFFCAVVTAIATPAIVGMAYGITLTLIYIVASSLEVYYITQILVLVSMLGAGTDYSVFIMTRYRDERKKGVDHDTALKTAIMWGGESVFTSGLSVMIGFGALALCSFSMVQTMGIVLAMGIFVALFAALTFTPSLLNLVGDKIFWPSNIEKYKGSSDGTRKGLWSRGNRFFGRYFKWLARVTEKYAKPIIVAFILLAIPSVYVFATTEDSSDMIGVMPGCESIDGLDSIMEQADGGTIMPNYVVIELQNKAYDEGCRGTSFYTMIDTNNDGVPDTRVETKSGYVIWNESALDLENQTGTIIDLSIINSAIDQKYGKEGTGIVGTSSGPVSWSLLFAMGQKEAVAAVQENVTQGVTMAVLNNLVNNEGMTQEQANAYIASEEGKELIGSKVAEKMASAEIQGEISHIIGEKMASGEVVEKINRAIVAKLPSLVQPAISEFFDNAGWDKAPGTVIGNASEDSSGKAVTVASVLDYGLNVKTGTLSDNGEYVKMTIITTEKPMSDGTMAFIDDLNEEFRGADGFDTTYSGTIANSWVSGTSAIGNDISEDVGQQFSNIRIVVCILLIALLFLILGSYLTPIRAILSIMLSVIIAIALTRELFNNVLDTPVVWIVPIVLFVVLLGLGMDYDIFMTTRIHENRIKGMDNHEAIRNAVEHTGSVISLCALIMGGTFLTLLFAGSPMLQELGFALGIGILFEGLIMVSYVVPALMHVMGDWSWKGPSFFSKKNSFLDSEKKTE